MLDLRTVTNGIYCIGLSITFSRLIIVCISIESRYSGDASLNTGIPSLIISFSKYIAKYFIENDVKAIVIACGTASALAFETLKNDYDVPIFNVIDSTVNHLNSNNIGIIATCASISSNVWDNKILEKLPNANITKVACPKLVPLAENGFVVVKKGKKVFHKAILK